MSNNKEYITIRLMGGLGNMMFQISAAYATSLRDNKNFFCDIDMFSVPHNHYSFYQDNILRNVIFKTKENINSSYNEVKFSYDEIPNLNGNVEISGYFQSEKYFKNFRNQILELFEPNNDTKIKIDSFYKKFEDKLSCSMHIRRSNYVSLQNYHSLQEIDYYKKSIEILGEDSHFLIFSDDIDWCNENLTFIKNKTLINEFSDYEQLYLMSLCNNNIIANSTFSWWGAWLNKNGNKKIICPKNWFGPANLGLNTEDIYCENWYII